MAKNNTQEGGPAPILPTEKTKPRCSIQETSILLYGASKIGKSTFASQAENAIFLATEPGLNALEVFQVPIRTWGDFHRACHELAHTEHDFDLIVIDTLDILYKLCAMAQCETLGLQHESQGEYGRVYGLIKNELYRYLTALAHLPCGLLMISHSTDKQYETRTGQITRTVPTLTEAFRQTVVGMVDIILYAEITPIKTGEKVEQTRVLRTKPHTDYDAGDRFGILPEMMPLDFPAFIKALEVGKEKSEDTTVPMSKRL